MGGIVDAIFGSTDAGGYEGQAPTMTKNQRKLLNDIINQIRPQIGQGGSVFEGPTVPGASDLQQSAFEMLTGILGGPQLDTVNQAVDRLMADPTQFSPTAVRSLNLAGPTAAPKFDPASSRQYWQEAFVDPAMKNFEQNIIPGIQEKYIAGDALDSGAARRAVANAAGNLQTNLSGQLANILQGEKARSEGLEFAAGESYAGRNLAAEQLMSQLGFAGGESAAGRTQASTENFLNRLLQVPGMQASGMIDPALAILNAGGVQRGIESDLLGDEYRKWQQGQAYNNPWLQMYAPMVLGAQATTPIIQGPSQRSGLFQDIVAPLLGPYLGTETGAAQAPKIFNPVAWF